MKTREQLEAELERLHARLADLERASTDPECLAAALRESGECFELGACRA